MHTIVLNSCAKLNLYLEVLRKRKDNYHQIQTLFERIDLCDKITLKSRQDKKINIISNSADIPKDRRNLAYRSAKLLQDNFKINRGVDIKIIKRIPVASGLGGGSSNAASVLVGLNRLWNLYLSKHKLVSLARKIGSDIPFFIYNVSFAQGQGRGDRIRPLRWLNKVKLQHILVVPGNKVSTVRIYKKWDVLRSGLTRPLYDVKILYLAIKKKDLALMAQALFNGLEEVTVKLYPQIRRIKNIFKNLGIKSMLMSGSGPAVFGIVSSRKEAVSACRHLKKQLARQNLVCQVFVTQAC